MQEGRNEILQAWLQDEFNQCFKHLRDRDARILEMTKFYVGLITSVVAVSATLMGTTILQRRTLWVGVLFCSTGIVGEILLLWLAAFRRYFVTTARQLNALRAHATSALAAEERKALVVHGTDPAQPPYWRVSSAHIVVLLLVAGLNGILLGAGTWGIVAALEPSSLLKPLGPIVGLLAMIGGILYCRLALREGQQ